MRTVDIEKQRNSVGSRINLKANAIGNSMKWSLRLKRRWVRLFFYDCELRTLLKKNLRIAFWRRKKNSTQVTHVLSFKSVVSAWCWLKNINHKNIFFSPFVAVWFGLEYEIICGDSLLRQKAMSAGEYSWDLWVLCTVTKKANLSFPLQCAMTAHIFFVIANSTIRFAFQPVIFICASYTLHFYFHSVWFEYCSHRKLSCLCVLCCQAQIELLVLHLVRFHSFSLSFPFTRSYVYAVCITYCYSVATDANVVFTACSLLL